MGNTAIAYDSMQERAVVGTSGRLTLKQARVRKLWSITRLAAESGIAASTVLDIERGRGTPRLSTIERLCRALGMEPEEIDWPGNPLGLDDADTPKNG